MVDAAEEDKKAEAKKEKKSDNEGAPQRQMDFGKKLAHTDKTVRDRGFLALKRFLEAHGDLVRFDYLKLWKGLYYAMWMSDKRPVQQDLSAQMALLINHVPPEKKLLWIDTFWEIMEDAWEKLDKHRVDKFMLFIRIVFAEALKVLREGGWKPAEMKGLGETLCRLVPKCYKGTMLTSWSTRGLGMLLHFNRVLWDELSVQLELEPKATDDAVMEFLEPFFILLERTGNLGVVNSVQHHVVFAAPGHFTGKLIQRLLQGAAKEEIPVRNREILYEMVDNIEKRHVATVKAEAEARDKLRSNGGVFSGVAPPKAKWPAEMLRKKRRKKQRHRHAKKRKAPEGEEEPAPKKEREDKAAVPSSGGQDGPPRAKRIRPPRKPPGLKKWEARAAAWAAQKAAKQAGAGGGAATTQT